MVPTNTEVQKTNQVYAFSFVMPHRLVKDGTREPILKITFPEGLKVKNVCAVTALTGGFDAGMGCSNGGTSVYTLTNIFTGGSYAGNVTLKITMDGAANADVSGSAGTLTITSYI